LFDYWNNQSFMQGVYLWNWDTDPNYGGNGNLDYSPQHKPAQDVMTTWFSGSGSATPPPPPPPQGNATFATSASAGPATQGQAVNVTSSVKNTSGNNASNLIVDTEIYDSNNSKVFQNYLGGQNINAGQTQNYNSSWTPNSNGTYVVKIGIFNSDWSQNYNWNNSAGTINVGSSSNNPPPPPPPNNPPPNSPGPLDIWWPTDGTSVSGVQPFKAMVENLNVSQYQMYWQVDGDHLNQMGDSQADYPHKESLVDLSGWNWHSDNNYNLNFVAKDLNANTIAQKAITIHVTH
jgi:hypothetical protein